MGEGLTKSQRVRARSVWIGRTIKSARKSLKLSQDQLGELLGGVSGASVCRAERGGQNFTVNALYQYAEALGISIIRLLPPEARDQADD